MYINPIEILGLSNIDSIAQIDNDTIKKEKRKLFADIDLSDDGHLDYYGLKLTKGNCEKAIDELSVSDNKEFYYYLANNKLLNEFLINGNVSLFSNFKQDSIFKLTEFIDFISPYYSTQFDKALILAFHKNDLSLFTSILKAPQLFSKSDVNNAYKSLTNYINSKITEIDSLEKTFVNEESDYNEISVLEVVELVKQAFPSSFLNQLPIYFQSQILRIANSINYLSNTIWKNFDTTLVSYELTGYLLTLNIDGLDKPAFENNFKIIKKKHEERIEQKKNAPLLKKWAAVLLKVRELIKNTDDEKTSPILGLEILNSLLDINELNALPSFADEIRNQIAFSIRSLSISMWNKYNDIKNSIITIKIAMKINVSNDASLKFKEDFDELCEIEKKYQGILVCHFCEKHPPSDGAQIKKTIYKETHRSHFPRSVQFSYVEIEIPRCKNCKQVHSLGRNNFRMFFLIGIIIGALIGFIADDHFVIGGLIGLGAGWLVGDYKANKIYFSHHIKSDSLSNLSAHPILKTRFLEGWSFYKPNA